MTEIKPTDLIGSYISSVDIESSDEYGDEILAIYGKTLDGIRFKVSNYGVDVMKVEMDDTR